MQKKRIIDRIMDKIADYTFGLIGCCLTMLYVCLYKMYLIKKVENDILSEGDFLRKADDSFMIGIIICIAFLLYNSCAIRRKK